MTDLPRLVQRAPAFFYAAAILFFLASIALAMREINSFPTSYDESMRPIVSQALARAVYQGSLEAVYLAANGVIVHILLAIWRSTGRHGSGADA